MTAWYVVDMDDGIVRREATKKACLRWCVNSTGGRVLRHGNRTMSPGFYEYFIGFDAEDCTQFWIAREDVLRPNGFDPDQQPLYPRPEEPYERAEEKQ